MKKYRFLNDINDIDENISFRFLDAGHMLGSAIVEIWITEEPCCP